MRITLDPLPVDDLSFPSADIIMDLQERAFEEHFFALRFAYADENFTYSKESLQVIAEDLIEEITRLLSKVDHEFCVSGYPLLDVKIDKNEFVSFFTASGEPLKSRESITVTDVLENLANLLKIVVIISSPLRVNNASIINTTR